MKGKILNKTRVAGAVMLATAGIAAGTAQADSLLAPLVISDTGNGIETYFAMKVRGAGISDQWSKEGTNAFDDKIHYYYLQKMMGMPGDVVVINGNTVNLANKPVTSVMGLYHYASGGGCKVTNNDGDVSSWDMIFQRATSWDGYDTNIIDDDEDGYDDSYPNGWRRDTDPNFDAGPFYGMMVMDDVSNLPENDGISPVGNNGRRFNEGDFSGFAYVVNNASGFMMDYKLLNNPLTKRSGDFKTGFISKNSIDWMWLPANNGRTQQSQFMNIQERTAWYTAVTGEGMSSKAEQGPGRWDEQVLFTTNDQAGAKSLLPLYQKNSVPAPGAYNNDETVLSGPAPWKVKCVGLYDRKSFLTASQFSQTRWGGWKRAHIVPVSHSGNPEVKVHGAITYRLDDLNGYTYDTHHIPDVSQIGGTPDIGITMQVETSGHLSTGLNKAHPNRPY